MLSNLTMMKTPFQTFLNGLSSKVENSEVHIQWNKPGIKSLKMMDWF